MRCTDPPASQRLRTQLARAVHEPARCTRPSADPWPALPGPGRGPALHGLSRGPVIQTGPGADNTTSQVERASGHPAGQDPRPTRTCHCRPRRALALHGPSRGPVTQTESDWPGANFATGLHHTSPGGLDQPGQTRYPGKAVSDSIHHLRSSADPRPATARPGGARAARTLPRAGAPD
jgi:hypothetical protein